MKRFIISLLAGILGMVSVAAQQIDALDIFIGKLAKSRASFGCDFTIENGSSQMGGYFDVTIQENAYHITGDGIEIWSDGQTVWTADTEAKEVIIESLTTDGNMAENPVWLICHLDKEFVREGAAMQGIFEGMSAQAFRMRSRNFRVSAILYFNVRNDVLMGVEAVVPDGSRILSAISSLEFSLSGKFSDFIPAAFTSSWVVTDLR